MLHGMSKMQYECASCTGSVRMQPQACACLNTGSTAQHTPAQRSQPASQPGQCTCTPACSPKVPKMRQSATVSIMVFCRFEEGRPKTKQKWLCCVHSAHRCLLRGHSVGYLRSVPPQSLGVWSGTCRLQPPPPPPFHQAAHAGAACAQPASLAWRAKDATTSLLSAGQPSPSSPACAATGAGVLAGWVAAACVLTTGCTAAAVGFSEGATVAVFSCSACSMRAAAPAVALAEAPP